MSVLIRASTDADLPAITGIYAWNVLNGLGTFEEVPPDATDEDGRPVMKLLLLAGPPGLGKVCPTAGAASILQQ